MPGRAASSSRGERVERGGHADVLAAVGVRVHAEHEVVVAAGLGQPGAQLGERADEVRAARAPVRRDRQRHGARAARRDLRDARPDVRARDIDREHVGAPRGQRFERPDLRTGADDGDPPAFEAQPLRVIHHAQDRDARRRLHHACLHPRLEAAAERVAAQLAAAVGDPQLGDARAGALDHLGAQGPARELGKRAQRQLLAVALDHEPCPHRGQAGLGDRQRRFRGVAECAVSSRTKSAYPPRQSRAVSIRSARSRLAARAASARIARPVGEVARRPSASGKVTPSPAGRTRTGAAVDMPRSLGRRAPRSHGARVKLAWRVAQHAPFPRRAHRRSLGARHNGGRVGG